MSFFLTQTRITYFKRVTLLTLTIFYLICGVGGSRSSTVLKCSGVESGLTKSYWTLHSIPAAFIIIKRVDIEPLYVNEGGCPWLCQTCCQNLHHRLPADAVGQVVPSDRLVCLSAQMQFYQHKHLSVSLQRNFCLTAEPQRGELFNAETRSAALSAALCRSGQPACVCLHLLNAELSCRTLQYSFLLSVCLFLAVEIHFSFSTVEHSLAWVPFLWMGHSAQGSGYWKDWKK